MEFRRNVPAKNITTYGGKGVLEEIYLPETIEEVIDLFRAEKDIFILGGGSNVIIPDGEIDKKVTSFARLNSIEIDGDKAVVAGGARLSSVVSKAREYGLGGLEFMAGVPATIGGLARMNAGAFGQEFGVYIDRITSLNPDNDKIDIFPPFNFGYRQGFQGVVIEVQLHLERMSKETSLERENEYRLARKLRQPQGRSTGSVFKNPDKSAGYYIDRAGLKGMRRGGAEISPLHGNFIINVDDGSAEDFLYLARTAKDRVYQQFGIELKEEFIVLGEI
ncbi:MAG: UDP-N-acetylmuramate dehydrogenase [Clostridia bacterium]|nr:UDP-N-acetylmuramate dehydrogenase [Clostridia bacterium]